jgi:hypothetical protein
MFWRVTAAGSGLESGEDHLGDFKSATRDSRRERMARGNGMRADRSKAELIFYGVCCALAVAVLRPSLQMGLGTAQELGPGLVPLIAALVILGTGIALIVRALLGKGQPPQAKNSESLHQKGWIRVLVILGGLAIWPPLSSVTGYVIPTFLVSFCIAKATGYSGWRGPVLLSIGVALGIWVLFSRVFSTDLPAGFFF